MRCRMGDRDLIEFYSVMISLRWHACSHVPGSCPHHNVQLADAIETAGSDVAMLDQMQGQSSPIGDVLVDEMSTVTC